MYYIIYHNINFHIYWLLNSHSGGAQIRDDCCEAGVNVLNFVNFSYTFIYDLADRDFWVPLPLGSHALLDPAASSTVGAGSWGLVAKCLPGNRGVDEPPRLIATACSDWRAPAHFP